MRTGRPPLSPADIALIKRLARENPTWEPEQIGGQFYQITGRRIHRDTVRKYLPRRNPDPLKALSWQKFLKLHFHEISAMDFFSIFRYGLPPLFGFFVIKHNRRELLHINVTANPTAAWLKDQLLMALGDSESIKYLISDNDKLFSYIWSYAEEVIGVRSVRTQKASPWQNGISERFVRTLRQELLNYIIPFSETVVRQRLKDYKDFYNNVRTHSTIRNQRPCQMPIHIPDGPKELVAIPMVGGLHNSYVWRKLA